MRPSFCGPPLSFDAVHLEDTRRKNYCDDNSSEKPSEEKCDTNGGEVSNKCAPEIPHKSFVADGKLEKRKRKVEGKTRIECAITRSNDRAQEGDFWIKNESKRADTTKSN